jgi:hypothetical protein
MKKVLALVVIAGSVMLFSCNDNKKTGEDTAKMKADSARIADSTARAKAKSDSAANAAKMKDTTKAKDTTANKPAAKPEEKKK